MCVIAMLSMGPSVNADASASVQLPTGLACRASPELRPKMVTFSCADDNLYFSVAHWSVWTNTAAVGTGRFTYNTCTPNCAGGTFISASATIGASVPRTLSGHLLFTRLVVNKHNNTNLTLNWSARGKFGTWDPTTKGFVPAFSPTAHRAALIALLETKSDGFKINVFTISASPLDPTWVLYNSGILVPGGEDMAEGYAHFATGHWIDVFGPASGFCLEPFVPGVPASIRASLAPAC